MATNYITVKNGVNEIRLNATDLTIDVLKTRVRSLLNLTGDEKVTVNGSAPDASRLLVVGDTVEFVKQSGAKGADTVEIKCGVNTMNLNVAGKKVSEVRRQTLALLTIPTGATAEVNGDGVGEDYELEAGDSLEFVKQSGAKGC